MQVTPNGIINNWQNRFNFLIQFTPAQLSEIGIDEIAVFAQHVGDPFDSWSQVGPNAGDVYIDSQEGLTFSFAEDSKDPKAFMAKLTEHINTNITNWIAAQGGVQPPAPSPTPSTPTAFPTDFAAFIAYCKAGGLYATDGPHKPTFWAEINDPKTT